eukprot:1188575-Prorocentrum_minimum.AAC.7
MGEFAATWDEISVWRGEFAATGGEISSPAVLARLEQPRELMIWGWGDDDMGRVMIWGGGAHPLCSHALSSPGSVNAKSGSTSAAPEAALRKLVGYPGRACTGLATRPAGLRRSTTVFTCSHAMSSNSSRVKYTPMCTTSLPDAGLHRRHRPPQQQHLLLANSSVTLVLHQCYTSVTSVLHQGLLRSFRSHSLCGFVRLWVRGFGWCCCGCVVVGVWCWMCGAGCGAHTGWAVADSAREGPAPRAVRGDELLQGLQPAMPEGLDGLYEQVAVFDGCNDPADGYEPFGSRLAILLHTTLEDAASES